MRKRDPRHEKRLQELQLLDVDACKQQISITNYKHEDFVASEVLATIIRRRYGEFNGVLVTAVEELNRRVVTETERMIYSRWYRLLKKDSELVEDTVRNFWTNFICDKSDVCNAEVRFQVYLSDTFIDYMKHLCAEKNSQPSIDSMNATDEDDESIPVIETIAGSSDFMPEELAIAGQSENAFKQVVETMSQAERKAYFLRIHCDYQWNEIAKLLECSLPTARKHLACAMEKLSEVLCDE